MYHRGLRARWRERQATTVILELLNLKPQIGPKRGTTDRGLALE